MIKAFIFDVGGTLVKTDEAILNALTIALKENGISFQEKDKEKVIRVFGQGQLKNVQTAVEVSYRGPEKEKKIKDCFASFQNIFPRKVMDDFALLPFVAESLDTLKKKGKKLAVLTGFDKQETAFFLEHLQLKKHFDLILSAEDIGKHRPNPQGLLIALERLQLKKEEVLYVGDAWVDIQFARNAGVKVCCVKTGAQDNALLEKEKPEYLVDDFKEMISNILSS